MNIKLCTKLALLMLFFIMSDPWQRLYGQGAQFEWVAALGESGDDQGQDIATDAAGNVYAIGQFKNATDFDPSTSAAYSLSPSGGFDVYIAKYSAAGALIWAKQLGAGSDDYGYAVTTDNNGYVYITGSFQGVTTYPLFPAGVTVLNSTGNYDVFVAKLDAATGNAIWAKSFGSTLADNSYDIAVDASGNVYTTGSFQSIEGGMDADPSPSGFYGISSAGSTDIFIHKLNASGNFVWAKRMGSTQADVAKSIALDATGNVYTTGTYNSQVDFDPGAGTFNLSSGQNGPVFISKLSAAGDLVWAKAYAADEGNAITIDNKGNVLVTGIIPVNSSGDFDPGPGIVLLDGSNGKNYISKFSSTGNLIWAKQVGTPTGSSQAGTGDVTTDTVGNVYAVGSYSSTGDFDPGPGTYTLGINSLQQVFILKLDDYGNFIWARGISGGGNAFGRGIALGNSMAVYTTGSFRSATDFDPGPGVTSFTGNSDDIFIHKMSQPICTDPPAAGTATANINAPAACSGNGVVLSLLGNTTDVAITYEWESSPAESPFTPTSLAPASGSPNLLIYPVASRWYRAKVSCNGGTPVYSIPVQVSISGALPAGTYTIDLTQPTAGGNFHSFTDAIAAIYCGIAGPVTFEVQPGVYNEKISIAPVPGASATNTITFNGNGNTLSFTATSQSSRAGITLNGADHIIINNLVIDGFAGIAGYGIFLTNQADSNTISNCTINLTQSGSNQNYAGIIASSSITNAQTPGNNANYNTITGNTINGGYWGIFLYGHATDFNTSNRITANNIRNNFTVSVYLYGQVNATVSGNDISKATRTDGSFQGVDLEASGSNNLIAKNKIHDAFNANPSGTGSAYPIVIGSSDATAAAPNRVENNIIYNIVNAGSITGISTNFSDYCNIYHNTILLNGNNATAGEAQGFNQQGDATGVNFRNNIVNITKGGSGNKYGIYMQTPTVSYTSNNNVIYLNGGGLQKTGRSGTTDYSTLADWQAGTGQDANSLGIDPVITGAPSGNLSPTNIAVENTGAALGITDDINGTGRSSGTPDAGAYEMSLCTGIPVAGNAVVNDSYICQSDSIVLNVLNQTVAAGIVYAWQSATDSIFTSPAPLSSTAVSPLFTYHPSVTLWYRATVTCGGNTVYTTPVKVNVSYSLPGGSYTINNALPTTGNNYQSFADALTALQCGVSGPVVFDIASGTFNEQVKIPQLNGTSATNTVTFNGNGATLQFNSSDPNNRAGITLDGADHVVLQNMIIDGTAGTYGYGILLTNRADSNIISGCTIRVSTTNTSAYNHIGIFASGTATSQTQANNANYTTITGNTISGGYYGIDLYGSSGAANNGNIIQNNTLTDAYAHHIYLYGQKNTRISNNDISRPTRTNFTDGGGIAMSFCSEGGNLIEKNRVHDLFTTSPTANSSAFGVYIESSNPPALNPNRVENNLMYNNDGNGSTYGIYNSASGSFNVYQNTILVNGNGNGAVYGFYQSGAVTGIDFRNNIIHITKGGSGAKYGIYMNTTGTAYTSNNNVIYLNSTGAGTLYSGRRSSSSYSTLADWQTGTGQDAASISADPQFTNIATGNLLPANISLDNTAAPLGIAQDIAGVFRSSTTPDPGAYEFGVIPSPLPVNWLSFEASIHEQNNVWLTWSTASEHNTKQYHMQRSTDAVQFETLGYVAAAGNSEKVSAYQYEDAQLVPGKYYYRILQEDADGSYVYTPVRKIVIRGQGATRCHIYPNPANNNLFISYEGTHPELAVTITDVAGRIVLSRKMAPNSLQSAVAIDMSDLAHGVYMISLKGAGINIHTKVIKK